MLGKRGDDCVSQIIWQDVFRSDLYHAWPGSVGERQHRAEVQIVSEHDVVDELLPSP